MAYWEIVLAGNGRRGQRGKQQTAAPHSRAKIWREKVCGRGGSRYGVPEPPATPLYRACACVRLSVCSPVTSQSHLPVPKVRKPAKYGADPALQQIKMPQCNVPSAVTMAFPAGLCLAPPLGCPWECAGSEGRCPDRAGVRGERVKRFTWVGE
ncbi:hypothetical protein E2C01_054435 [Portunus trituberculatus]|uniref:Uncharacterized protein n=1 Tax=Portunus trituberculatus TaxID=210409 RepID=A0A5B7GJU5_PORTR|nr:hypothetical protein [Portunus trituberculatus]